MKWIIVGSVVTFAIGYAWMETAKSPLDANIGFVIMGAGLASTVITGCVLLHSLQLL
jgi:hypothetical protein